jgi:MFS transporter, ACS family, hexuronate transporter
MNFSSRRAGGSDVTARTDHSMRWVMIGLVFWATVINYLDRQTLSVVAPMLIERFHMTNVDYSRVIFVFMLAYTVMNGVSGPLIDRVGTRLGYAVTTAWWSASAMLHALAVGPWSLGAFRFLLGMGEAGNWPAGVKVVAEWFPPEERALASGIFTSGSAVGAILAPPLVAAIVLKFGWRAAFMAVGAIGFVWLVVWLFVYYTPAEDRNEPRLEPIPVRTLLQTRFVPSLMLAKCFTEPAWYFYIFWFPAYLKQARHFNLAAIGKFAWIPFAVAGAGYVLGGWLCGALLRRGVSVTLARKSSATIFACLMTSAIPAALVSDVRLSIALVSLAMVGYTGSQAVTLAMPADVFPKTAVASVWGLASLGTGVGGMIFALVTGWLVDHYSYVPAFVLFGTIPLIFVLILWFALGPLVPLGSSRSAN